MTTLGFWTHYEREGITTKSRCRRGLPAPSSEIILRNQALITGFGDRLKGQKWWNMTQTRSKRGATAYKAALYHFASPGDHPNQVKSTHPIACVREPRVSPVRQRR